MTSNVLNWSELRGYVKWAAFSPLSILSSLAAWLVSPIMPFFVNRETWRYPAWLAWASTPNTDARGDPAHKAKHGDSNSWWQLVHWVLRNPAVVFQKKVLGHVKQAGDVFICNGDPETTDGGHAGHYFSRVYRDGKLVAWQFYLVWQYPFKKDKCIRLCYGWKLWNYPRYPAGELHQHTMRTAPWKSFRLS